MIRRYVKLALIFLAILLLAQAGECYIDIPNTHVAGLQADGREVRIAYNDHSMKSGFVEAYSLGSGRLIRRTRIKSPLAEGICTSGSTLYVLTLEDGTYGLDLKTGRIASHLIPKNYESPGRIACTSDLVVIAGGQDESVLIGAFHKTSLRPVWEHSIPKSYIWGLSEKNGNIEVLVSDIWRYDCLVLHEPRFTRWLLRGKDGAVLSRTRAGDPRDTIPKTLPISVRKALDRMLKRQDIYLSRTRIERLGNLWYVGRLQQAPVNSGKYRVFALNGDTGRIAWSRDFLGLTDIAVSGKSLIVAAMEVGDWGMWDTPARTAKHGWLVSLDAASGRVQWAVKVPVR